MHETTETGYPSRARFLEWLFGKTVTTWLLSTSIGGFLAAVLYPVGKYLVPPEVIESAVSSVTLPFPTSDVAS
ncbi:MAG: hypothetical protein OEY63_08360, partial [Gemmatimonadota bacterium]|nr:hypothetical protein [Gemmatimonadota bacterium]